jgi:uncharacterized phage protein (TIGR02220 family)
MKKDTYYFPHDFNAHNDEKCLYLISELGMQGYGLYWAFIEAMHDTSDGKLKVSFLNVFSIRFNTEKEALSNFYNTAISIGLFVTDGEYYWSERVMQNKVVFDEKRQKKSKAGKLGMQARWAKDNSVITDDNNAITKHNKGKEIKGKESKVNESKEKYSDFIESVCLITGKSYRGDKKSERAFNARIKEGYEIEDILEALENAVKQENHIKNNFRYLTPEFITRQDKIELYKNK